MAKLTEQVEQKKSSTNKKRPKRFYTDLDMATIKHDQAVRNSQAKRGEVEKKGNEYISECGCGFEGCFIHSGYDSVDQDRANEFEKEQAEDRNKSIEDKQYRGYFDGTYEPKRSKFKGNNK